MIYVSRKLLLLMPKLIILISPCQLNTIWNVYEIDKYLKLNFYFVSLDIIIIALT